MAIMLVGSALLQWYTVVDEGFNAGLDGLVQPNFTYVDGI